MHDCDYNGVWLHRPSGSTLTLTIQGDHAHGHWKAGPPHETLRGEFNGRRDQDGFAGDYRNREGVVTGVGHMRVQAIGPDQILFHGHGDWSGGGASGHVDGSYTLDRHC